MKVEFQKIQKHFKEVDVLKEVNLVVESGKIMCLLGPSGSGKTTLIRILTVAIKADAGVVKVGELTMPNMAAMWKIGFMPQNDGVYNDISGLDNLMFYGKLYSMKKEKLKARIKELLEMLNLWEDRNKLVANYSGGMKKRLSLAIAILHEPELLVLDEPTVGIDPMLRKVIWDEFHKLKKQGKTIIVSTRAFVSIFANSEFQVIQFIPIVIIPQIFYSGLLSLNGLPFNLDKLEYVMPVYYGCTALKKVLINGQGFADIGIYIALLIAFIFVFFALNVISLKKYRAI